MASVRRTITEGANVSLPVEFIFFLSQKSESLLVCCGVYYNTAEETYMLHSGNATEDTNMFLPAEEEAPFALLGL